MRNPLFRLFAVLGIMLLPLLGQAQGTAAQETRYYREVPFSTAVVLTTTTPGAGVTGLAPASLAGFQLSCTEDSGTASLDVAVQRSLDGGATWLNLLTFTQLTATGSETKTYADVRAASAQILGDRLRANYTVTGTGQYTCTLLGVFEG